ncbi:MAG: asparagine synthase-related protein [Terriglobales bacterium]|jgi:asparagine synthase (glutamine-hydrolysing)
MSVQFGRWNFDHTPPDREYIEKATSSLVPYGPDGQNSYSKSGLTIVYRAFHTTKEAKSEYQPHRSKAGAVITWDGRLDNRAELRQQLSLTLESGSPDVLIVAAAYDRWGRACLAKLIGDWALSIWTPEDQSLTLAKDPIGTRPLYYARSDAQVTWSSLLDPLVLFADRSFALSEEYVAGWLSFFPAAHLTPYVGICSVPPSSFIHVTRNALRISKYWDFDADERIRYRTDQEYEEHFRSVFGQAVRRRLRSDAPVMAELSGGMDSSSIVGMADMLIGGAEAETPRVDTISYYDDSEPNWNERPYFAKVEEKRGRTGCHIDVSAQQERILKFDPDCFAAAPSSRCPADLRFATCMRSGGYRVLLSGIGGDEITGGVPTPLPELEDLLARARLRLLVHQLKAWSLERRKPWIHLLSEAARGFLPPALLSLLEHRRPAAWLRRAFIKRHRAALTGYESRLKFFGGLPSFQENVSTLDMLRRQLGFGALLQDPLHEKRYPYLDRSLLEFVFSIPREQLVRPGQRRSLLRRSLVGIVPDEILQRKRKAFVTRSAMAAIAKESAALVALSRDMVSHCLGIVDPDALREAIRKANTGQEVPVVTLMRTLDLEFWLKGAMRTKVLRQPVAHSEQGSAQVKTAFMVTDQYPGK